MSAVAPTLTAEDDVVRASIPATDAASIAGFFDGLVHLEKERRAHGVATPIRILYAIRGQRMPDTDARRLIYARWREFDARFVAVVGTSATQEFIVNFLVQATGHSNTRYFTDEAKALAWLGSVA